MSAAGTMSPQHAFEAVETMVQGWALPYSHHILLVSDGGKDGIIFAGITCAVLFSKPTSSVPIPPQMAAITATVVPSAGEPPAITYALEGEMMQRSSSERLDAKLLDKLIARKLIVEERAGFHRETDSLPRSVATAGR